MENEELNEKLRQGIKFTKDDLHMNRQGRLTPSQSQMLKSNDAYNGSMTGKLIIGIAIGGVGLGIAKEGLQFFTWQLLLGYFGMFILMYGGYYLYNQNNLKKLAEGKVTVEKIEGRVNAFYDEKVAGANNSIGQYTGVVKTATSFAGINYGDYAYALELAGKKLYTTKLVYDAFKKDHTYAIYFVRSTKREYQNMIHGAVIVSAEAI